MFAVALSLERRRCLVVGAGGVALRKILSLVDEQAFVTVVAPAAVAEVEALATKGGSNSNGAPIGPEKRARTTRWYSRRPTIGTSTARCSRKARQPACS